MENELFVEIIPEGRKLRVPPDDELLGKRRLQPRQHDAALRLILPLFVLVAHFAGLIAFKEQHLAQTFVGVNLRGQRSGVTDFQSYETFPP